MQLLLIVTVVFGYVLSTIDVFAESPSFVRQQINDDDTNKSQILDIESVNYLSDGKILNATIWLSPFKEQFKTQGLVYMMLVDAEGRNDSGIQGIDYAVGRQIDWDNQDKFTTLYELSSTGKPRLIHNSSMDYLDSSNVENDYLSLTLDLEQINYPSQYDIKFVILANQNSLFKVIDKTDWDSIPPPKVEITTSPGSITLKPGESRTVTLRLNSTSVPSFYARLYKSSIPGIQSWITNNTLYFPPHENTDYITTQLNISVGNVKEGTYVMTIGADVHNGKDGFNSINHDHAFTEFGITVGSQSNPVQINIPTDTLVSMLLVVVAAIVGWFIPSIARWFNAKRQGKHVDRYITRIIDAYRGSDQNKLQSIWILENIRFEVAHTYSRRKITESDYKILNDKISEYERRIQLS